MSDTAPGDERSTLQPAVSGFNWPALVEETRPGQDTPLQRAQANRLRQALTNLREWASRMNLFAERVEPAAAFAVVSTLPGAPDALVHTLARLFLWVFTVDSWLDEQPTGRLDDEEWRDDTLRVCTGSLRAWADTGQGAPSLASPGSYEDARAIQLSATAHAWMEATIAEWPESPPAVVNAWARIVAQQTINVVAYMRQEFAWSTAYRKRQRGQADTNLPTLEEYLAVAALTVGIHPAAALVCAGLGEPLNAWDNVQPAITSAARVIRLANDAATSTADAAGGNLTAATLLRAVVAKAPDDQAQSERLHAILAHEIAVFAERLNALGDEPPDVFLRRVVAHALAYYSR